MIKGLYTLVVLFICNSWATAQYLDWVKSTGDASPETVEDIVVDQLGNVYVIGSFYGTVDFDPSPTVYNLTAIGDQDIFIQKLDAAGNLVWAKSFGGANMDYGKSIFVDATGNVYTAGAVDGAVDFDPNTAVNSLIGGGFVQKLDVAGNLVWAKTFGTTTNEQVTSIAVDLLGNVHLVGLFNSTVDFDPNPAVYNLTSNGQQDIFMVKLDAVGSLVWAKSIGGPFLDWGYDIALDAQSDVYTTGNFGGVVDFDPNQGTSNLIAGPGGNMYIQKLDATGNLVWAKSTANGGSGKSIVLDNAGYLYATGRSTQKLDLAGNIIWAEYGQGESIAVDTAHNVYVTGSFSGTVDFDPSTNTTNLNSMGTTDMYVQKLDSAGSFVWVKQAGGAGSFCHGYGIVTDELNNIYIAGEYRNAVDFDPNSGINTLIAVGDYDIYIQKWSPNLPTGIERIEENLSFKVYPNPSTGVFNIELPQGAKAGQIQVVDNIGQVVYEGILTEPKSILDLSTFALGVYHAKMYLDTGQHIFAKILLVR
ncbi:MAG: T9SS type A sorting domain-containing protein [Aureispira sp.]|nr:T9SS type A sorting domain-containing protein [Aureispira sp.]